MLTVALIGFTMDIKLECVMRMLRDFFNPLSFVVKIDGQVQVEC